MIPPPSFPHSPKLAVKKSTSDYFSWFSLRRDYYGHCLDYDSIPLFKNVGYSLLDNEKFWKENKQIKKMNDKKVKEYEKRYSEMIELLGITKSKKIIKDDNNRLVGLDTYDQNSKVLDPEYKLGKYLEDKSCVISKDILSKTALTQYYFEKKSENSTSQGSGKYSAVKTLFFSSPSSYYFYSCKCGQHYHTYKEESKSTANNNSDQKGCSSSIMLLANKENLNGWDVYVTDNRFSECVEEKFDSWKASDQNVNIRYKDFNNFISRGEHIFLHSLVPFPLHSFFRVGFPLQDPHRQYQYSKFVYNKDAKRNGYVLHETDSITVDFKKKEFLQVDNVVGSLNLVGNDHDHFYERIDLLPYFNAVPLPFISTSECLDNANTRNEMRVMMGLKKVKNISVDAPAIMIDSTDKKGEGYLEYDDGIDEVDDGYDKVEDYDKIKEEYEERTRKELLSKGIDVDNYKVVGCCYPWYTNLVHVVYNFAKMSYRTTRKAVSKAGKKFDEVSEKIFAPFKRMLNKYEIGRKIAFIGGIALCYGVGLLIPKMLEFIPMISVPFLGIFLGKFLGFLGKGIGSYFLDKGKELRKLAERDYIPTDEENKENNGKTEEEEEEKRTSLFSNKGEMEMRKALMLPTVGHIYSLVEDINCIMMETDIYQHLHNGQKSHNIVVNLNTLDPNKIEKEKEDVDLYITKAYNEAKEEESKKGEKNKRSSSSSSSISSTSSSSSTSSTSSSSSSDVYLSDFCCQLNMSIYGSFRHAANVAFLTASAAVDIMQALNGFDGNHKGTELLNNIDLCDENAVKACESANDAIENSYKIFFSSKMSSYFSNAKKPSYSDSFAEYVFYIANELVDITKSIKKAALATSKTIYYAELVSSFYSTSEDDSVYYQIINDIIEKAKNTVKASKKYADYSVFVAVASFIEIYGCLECNKAEENKLKTSSSNPLFVSTGDKKEDAKASDKNKDLCVNAEDGEEAKAVTSEEEKEALAYVNTIRKILETNIQYLKETQILYQNQYSLCTNFEKKANESSEELIKILSVVNLLSGGLQSSFDKMKKTLSGFEDLMQKTSKSSKEKNTYTALSKNKNENKTEEYDRREKNEICEDITMTTSGRHFTPDYKQGNMLVELQSISRGLSQLSNEKSKYWSSESSSYKKFDEFSSTVQRKINEINKIQSTELPLPEPGTFMFINIASSGIETPWHAIITEDDDYTKSNSVNSKRSKILSERIDVCKRNINQMMDETLKLVNEKAVSDAKEERKKKEEEEDDDNCGFDLISSSDYVEDEVEEGKVNDSVENKTKNTGSMKEDNAKEGITNNENKEVEESKEGKDNAELDSLNDYVVWDDDEYNKELLSRREILKRHTIFTEVDGDGVVPSVSAFNECMPADARFEIRNTSHSGILKSHEALNLVAAFEDCRMPYPLRNMNLSRLNSYTNFESHRLNNKKLSKEETREFTKIVKKWKLEGDYIDQSHNGNSDDNDKSLQYRFNISYLDNPVNEGYIVQSIVMNEVLLKKSEERDKDIPDDIPLIDVNCQECIPFPIPKNFFFKKEYNETYKSYFDQEKFDLETKRLNVLLSFFKVNLNSEYIYWKPNNENKPFSENESNDENESDDEFNIFKSFIENNRKGHIWKTCLMEAWEYFKFCCNSEGKEKERNLALCVIGHLLVIYSGEIVNLDRFLLLLIQQYYFVNFSDPTPLDSQYLLCYAFVLIVTYINICSGLSMHGDREAKRNEFRMMVNSVINLFTYGRKILMSVTFMFLVLFKEMLPTTLSNIDDEIQENVRTFINNLVKYVESFKPEAVGIDRIEEIKRDDKNSKYKVALALSYCSDEEIKVLSENLIYFSKEIISSFGQK